MKLTTKRLKQLIKEELGATLREEDGDISIPELDEDFFNAKKPDIKYIGSWMGGETADDNLDLYQFPDGTFLMVTPMEKIPATNVAAVLKHLETMDDEYY
jgi:hypothetical protein